MVAVEESLIGKVCQVYVKGLPLIPPWRFKTNPTGFGAGQEFRDPPPDGQGYDLDKNDTDSGGDPTKDDYEEVAEHYYLTP